MPPRLRALVILAALASSLPLAATTDRANIDLVILTAARHAPGDDPAALAAFLRLVENPTQDASARAALAAAYASALTQLDRDGTGTPTGWSTLARALPFLQDQNPALIPSITRAAAAPGFTDAALTALTELGSPAADAAIAQLLTHPSRDVQLAAFTAAGRRQLSAALPVLAAQLSAADSDPDLADAALYALADFTTPDALRTLAALPAPTSASRLDSLNRTRLQIARSLASAGQRDSALPTLRALSAPGPDAFLRGEALRLLLDPAAPDYAATVSALLRGDDAAEVDAALDALRHAPPPDAVATLLPTLPEPVAVRTLDALVTARDPAVLDFARDALSGPSPALALASAKALATAGDATHAPALLVEVQTSPAGDLRAAAADALTHLAGGLATNLAIYQALASPPANATSDSGPALVRILAARGAIEHKPALLALVPQASTARPLRTAILRSLEQFGSADDVPVLLAHLDGAAPALASQFEQAITIQLQRARGTLDADALIESHLPAASPAFAASLLRLSAAIATPASLARVERATRSAEPSLRPVAIRLLASWPEPSAIPALLNLLASPDSAPAVPRVILLRGITRLLDHADLVPAEKSVLLSRLPALLQTPEERDLAAPFLTEPTA